MLHSIIIPHRDRNRYLAQCLYALARSARACDVTDYEVLVVDHQSTEIPHSPDEHTRIVVDQRPMGLWNKPRLQNLGIEVAGGKLLSFLDADTIVGQGWFSRAERLGDATKLCYRVRGLPHDHLEMLEAGAELDASPSRDERLDYWFRNYDRYELRHEAYGLAHKHRAHPEPGMPVFGNSHFTIRHDVLGTLRFNEDYSGRSFEDSWMNREIWRRDKGRYRAAIVTRGSEAAFTIGHPGEDRLVDYSEQVAANRRRYHADKDPTEELDICIPTLLPREKLQEQMWDIQANTRTSYQIIASCQRMSAAANRNHCLQRACGQILIMLDDDITGFFPGWEQKLIEPLLADKSICMVSARLANRDGTCGVMCSNDNRLKPRWLEIEPRRDCVLPSAAIAFRNLGLRFDENYVGSGYEDSDFCFQYVAMNAGRFAINNECRLIHLNEMKNQPDNNVRNRKYFRKKWGVAA